VVHAPIGALWPSPRACWRSRGYHRPARPRRSPPRRASAYACPPRCTSCPSRAPPKLGHAGATRLHGGWPMLPSGLPPGAMKGGGDSAQPGATAQRGFESVPTYPILTCRRGLLSLPKDSGMAGQVWGSRHGVHDTVPVVRAKPGALYGLRPSGQRSGSVMPPASRSTTYCPQGPARRRGGRDHPSGSVPARRCHRH